MTAGKLLEAFFNAVSINRGTYFIMRIINLYFKILKVKTSCYAVNTRFFPSSLARYMTTEDGFRIKSKIIGSCPPLSHRHLRE
jgi:hypothetical protein